MQTIDDLGEYTFSALLKNSVLKFSNRPALSYVSEQPISYTEFKEKIESTKGLLHSLGIKPLDKVAIFSTSSPQWAVSYFAIVTLGAVAVPLLPDFNEDEAMTCIKHSGTKAVFIGEKLFQKLKNAEELDIIINIEDFSVKKGKIKTDTPIPEHKCKEEDIASIIYTSGTTGRSKGVVLTHKNLIFTAIAGQNCQRINQYEAALSILPMSHVYEFTIGFLMFILNGACIYYLEGPPTPRNLLPALQKVRPHFMLAVPIIIEKIYKQKILPAFNASPLIKKIYGTKLGRKLLCRKAGKKLKKTFGGRLKFFGIGGSKTDPVVEQFMVDAKFPYAIGYGLTETSPLIAYSAVYKTVPGVIGITVPEIEIKIGNKDPQTGVGELLVKGPNVMKGYYNAPDLTKEAFTEDGWFKTGDLCIIDDKGKVSLKGRSKNMILGAAGENIYPEDIEFVLNQHPLVSESLVVEGENTSLVAYVRLQDAIGGAVSGISNAIMHKREEVLNEIRFFVNSKVNKFSKIDKIELVDEFEKTASQKIKRYLYTFRYGKTQNENLKEELKASLF
ncbi:AMP-binding protein [Treponema putidum]|uniref:AMP-binding protein n=1 Tax=Treponema putidum TaxID=221027 RepID=UPI0004F5EA4F|nr:AMP-binding protein [Treponema putidum]AIN92944.1 AMP-binding protein [Treponema putidum]TWI74255.1 long-chain acyl-CoA synthetase [Treponema putidum]